MTHFVSSPLRDGDVRRAAYHLLLSHACRCPDTLVLDELGLAHGASRIDIAIINGHIRGVEIKAEADSLARLPHQIAAYGRVVDRATLIAAERHISGALDMLPDWWGVISAARSRRGAVTFRRLRAEKSNRMIDPMTLVRLLWRGEVLAHLRALGHEERALRGPRVTLYGLLVASVSCMQLRHTVRETLKARENWRGRALPL